MTEDHADGKPGDRLRPFQFGIRGLFVLAFAVAVGFSTLGTEHARWFHVLFGAGLALTLLGLTHQVVDLCQTFYGRMDLSADHRWGWRFEVFWRLGVATLLVGYYAMSILLERKVLSLPDRRGDDFFIGSALRDVVAVLAAVIIFAAIERPGRERPSSRRSRWIALLGAIAGICWYGVAVANWLLIPFLVHVSIQGIGCAEPLWLATEGFGLVSIAKMHAFFWCSLLSVGGLLVSLALIGRLARRPPEGSRHGWVTVGLLACSLGIAGICVTWLCTDGIRSLAPMYVQVWDPGPGHIWITASLLILTFVTAATRRIVSAGDTLSRDPLTDWRRRPQAYYHERRAVLFVMATGLIALLTETFLFYLKWFGFGLQAVLDYLGFMLILPQTLFFMALLLVAVQKAVTGWRRSDAPVPTGVPELPLARFCAVWVALLLTVVLAVPAIAGLGFAVWMIPMLRLW